MVAETIFFLMAVSACVFASLAVISRDVFHCAVWLALTLMSIACVYFCLDAEFLGVIQVLVYVGGIVTLFIFAIKLTANIGDERTRQVNAQLMPAAIVSLILFYILAEVIARSPWKTLTAQAPTVSLQKLGASLMTAYVLPFEFISLLLLAVLVGAIVIGRVKR